MSRRIILSLAVAIAALLLGLVLAFVSRSRAPQPLSQPEQTQQAAPPAQQAETPVPDEPLTLPDPAGYVLRSYNGRLAIFQSGSESPEMIFDVYTRLLPQADRERLESGISAPDYETLARLIEDYTS